MSWLKLAIMILKLIPAAVKLVAELESRHAAQVASREKLKKDARNDAAIDAP